METGLQGDVSRCALSRFCLGLRPVMSRAGDRVRMVEMLRGPSDPYGTVTGFVEDDAMVDVMVRWDVGIEAALAPTSLVLAEE